LLIHAHNEKLTPYQSITHLIILTYTGCFRYSGMRRRSSWDAKEEGNEMDYLHNLGAAQDYNSECQT